MTGSVGTLMLSQLGKVKMEALRLESLSVLVETRVGGAKLIYDTFLSGPELTLQSSCQGQPLFQLRDLPHPS